MSAVSVACLRSRGHLDAGDKYTGLDRFGRVVDLRWIDVSSGDATDRFLYSYDRDGNRLTKDNLVNADFDEAYSYDELNRLADFEREISGDIIPINLTAAGLGCIE